MNNDQQESLSHVLMQKRYLIQDMCTLVPIISLLQSHVSIDYNCLQKELDTHCKIFSGESTSFIQELVLQAQSFLGASLWLLKQFNTFTRSQPQFSLQNR